jgi:hypothetical protein
LDQNELATNGAQLTADCIETRVQSVKAVVLPVEPAIHALELIKDEASESLDISFGHRAAVYHGPASAPGSCECKALETARWRALPGNDALIIPSLAISGRNLACGRKHSRLRLGQRPRR